MKNYEIITKIMATNKPEGNYELYKTYWGLNKKFVPGFNNPNNHILQFDALKDNPELWAIEVTYQMAISDGLTDEQLDKVFEDSELWLI